MPLFGRVFSVQSAVRSNIPTVIRTMMVVSYISIICQLHRINIERRSLTINTAIPLTYKYHSSKVDKYQAASGCLSTDLTSRQTTGQTLSETTESITTSPDSIKITETQIVEEFDDGKPRKCWSILSYRDKNSRSQSVIIKQTKHKQRRLSDFIGLSKVLISIYPPTTQLTHSSIM